MGQMALRRRPRCLRRWNLSPGGSRTPVRLPARPVTYAPLRRVGAALVYRDFRILWLGALTSSIGTWMQKVAQN